MNRARHWMAGALLLFGFPICLLAILKLSEKQISAADRSEVKAALVLFGLAPTSLGAYLVWDARRRWQIQQGDRLNAMFFHLVQVGQGQLSAMEFAMTAGISGSAAKAYLDERAREFNATFDVNDLGGIFYHFPLVPRSLVLEEALPLTYDLILESMPEPYRQMIMLKLQGVTGLEWNQVEALLQTMPATICQRVRPEVAIAFRDQLQSMGAKITLVLN